MHSQLQHPNGLSIHPHLYHIPPSPTLLNHQTLAFPETLPNVEETLLNTLETLPYILEILYSGDTTASPNPYSLAASQDPMKRLVISIFYG